MMASLQTDNLMKDLVHSGLYKQVDVVGVDEGQFFLDIVEAAETMSNEGKTVIVAGLDGTYEQKPFNAIL